MASVTKRGKGFLFRVSVGYDSEGNQIVKSMTWTPPSDMTPKKAEKAAYHEAELFEEKVKTGMIASGKMKFAEFVEKWMADYAEVQLRPRTVARYKQMMDRLLPALGHLYLDKITPAILIDYFKELAQSPKRVTRYECTVDLKAYLKKRGMTKDACAKKAGVAITTMTAIYQGKNVTKSSAEKVSAALGLKMFSLFEDVTEEEYLSSKTLLNYYRLVSSIMHTAVKWQVIVANPCERVDPPKAGKTKMDVLDVDEAIRLVELLDGVPIYYRTAIIVLLFTGMRRGELLGLEWSDISFSKSTISITKTLQYLPNRGLFDDETKTESSERVIKVPKAAMKALYDLKQWQMEQSFLMADAWQDCDKVMTGADGSCMRPDTLTNWFRDFIDHSDLPQIHLHSLRHTNATLSIANGVAVTTVAGQLGHVDSSTTTKIYAHAIKSAQAEAAEIMDNLLTPVKKKPVKRRCG